MRTRGSLRGFLILSNVLLLVLPHVSWPRSSLAQSTRKPDPQPALQPSPQPAHHAPGKVRPRPSPSPRTAARSTSTQPSSDDDDAGEVAGDIAAGCCAGMVGAMASTPSTPEDVDLPEMPPEVDDPGRYGTGRHGRGGAPPSPEPGSTFDSRAARVELEAAETRARDKCGTSLLEDDIQARVVFASTGDPIDVQFIPEGFTNSEHGKCVEGELLNTRVPPFDGPPTAAVRTMILID